ncbi:MAG: DHA2 family efflux MFS transporter permease subunit [Anaerotardibacter sp.]
MGITKKEAVMVGLLLFGAWMVVLNQTLLSPALPAIMNDLQISATTVQWLTSGYALAEAIIIPLSAYFIGRFTTRQLYMGGMAVFAFGTFLACISPCFEVLLLGRVFQALSTGVMMPMVFTVILVIFPREKRGSAMGLTGLIISFAPAIGPSVSGVLVDTVGWRALFLIVIAVSVIALIAAFFLLENKTGFEPSNFDKPSVILLVLGMLPLLYGLSSFSSSENIALTAGLIVVGLVLLAFFVKRQLSLEVPLLKISILKSVRYRTVVILVAILQCAFIGGNVMLPLYVQQGLGYSATVTGLVMLPGAIMGAIASVLAGRMFDKHGVRGIALFGGAAMALGGVALGFLGADTHIVLVAAAFTIAIFGLQLIITPLNTWGVNSLPNNVIQHANALGNTCNQIGGSLGTALIVSLAAMGSSMYTGDPAQAVIFGDHCGLVAMGIIYVLVFLCIVVFVRNKFGAAQQKEIDKQNLEMMKAHAREMAQTDSRLSGLKGDWYVSDVMNTEPTCLSSTSMISDAIALFAKNDTSGVILVDENNKIKGFLSDGDLMKYLAKEDIYLSDGYTTFKVLENEALLERLESLMNKRVMDLATKSVISVKEDDFLENACKVLSERRIKKLPVEKDGILVGTLSRRDIIHQIAKGQNWI